MNRKRAEIGNTRVVSMLRQVNDLGCYERRKVKLKWFEKVGPMTDNLKSCMERR